MSQVNDTSFDFELGAPAGACTFTVVGSVMNLDGDCTTDESIVIPDGMTLAGHYFTITAVDPAGGHFTGGVIENGGATASVKRVKIDAGGLANVCDAGADRLRGILFDGASGKIYRNTILAVNQGVSGCQEGNGIEVRNEPFDGTHPGTVIVSIRKNTVTDYQKGGIVVNGDVSVHVGRNTVGASQSQSAIAANSVQMGYGATGTIRDNRITGNSWFGCDPDSSNWVATAILVFGPGDGKRHIRKNTIDGNADYGIYYDAHPGVIKRNKVFDNGADPNTGCPSYDYGIGNYTDYFDPADNTYSKVYKNKLCGWVTPYDAWDYDADTADDAAQVALMASKNSIVDDCVPAEAGLSSAGALSEASVVPRPSPVR